jgi:hypothetical protein
MFSGVRGSKRMIHARCGFSHGLVYGSRSPFILRIRISVGLHPSDGRSVKCDRKPPLALIQNFAYLCR